MNPLDESFSDLTPVYQSGEWSVLALSGHEQLAQDYAQADYILWTSVVGAVAATAERLPNGNLKGCYVGGQGVQFEASSFAEMVSMVERIEKTLLGP